MHFVKLSEVCDIIQGGRHKKSGNNFVSEGGFPAYGAGGLNGYLDFAEFDQEAVILSSIGARCGKCFYTEGSWTSLANTQVILPSQTRVNAKFLWFQLNDESRWPRAGTGQPFIKPSDVKDHRIYLPSLPEQTRIATLLDKAAALRAKRSAALAELDSLTQAVFLEMFGDPRKKGTTGSTPTKECLMGGLTRIRTGKLDANAADEDGAHPFFTCAAEPLRINTPAFDCKAVLVAGNGDLNVKYYEGKFNAYQRTYVIESLDERILAPKFLYAFLNLYIGELRKQAIGGVIKYIKLPYLTEAVMQLPPPSAQQDFVRRLTAVEALRDTHRTALAELDALFASLQHRAFRGEL